MEDLTVTSVKLLGGGNMVEEKRIEDLEKITKYHEKRLGEAEAADKVSATRLDNIYSDIEEIKNDIKETKTFIRDSIKMTEQTHKEAMRATEEAYKEAAERPSWAITVFITLLCSIVVGLIVGTVV